MSNKSERGKGPWRGNKSKTPAFPQDLYLLGPKGTTKPDKTDTKRTTVTVPTKAVASASQSLSERRKLPSSSGSVASNSGASTSGGSSSNAVSSTSAGSSSTGSSGINIPPIKKPKIVSSLLSKHEGYSSTSAADPSKSWENLASDVDPSDLVSAVLEAKENGEESKMVSLLCGAFKLLRNNRLRIDTALCNGLLLIAKLNPSVFANETVFNALCSVLKRESSLFGMKSKVNMGNIVLIVNLLYQGFKDIKRWPEIFIKLYVEDSIGERLWVDNEHCKCFIENIIASIHTRPSSAYDIEPGMKSDDIDDNLREQLLKDKTAHHVFPRYKHCQDASERMIIDYIKEQLSRRQTLEGINKNLLKFLACMCGIVEVRGIIVGKLELWLHSPKLMKSAQELLMALCINCTSHTPRDIEIVSAIGKIRLKTKALSGFYFSCIKELIPANSKNLPVVLKQTIQNELSSSRNPNNMPMLSTLFQSEPEKCAEIFSDIFLEILIGRDDALKPLRALLREIARVIRSDFNLMLFCRGLMSRIDSVSRESEHKERIFNSIIDLITLSIFLCVMPYARSERRDISQQLERMQKTIAHIQSDAIWWFHETVIRVYRPSVNDFIRGLHKVLILEPGEQYCKIDNWPPEQDRAVFLRHATEVPLLESTVIRLLVIGISKDYPLVPSDAIELVDQLVQRAAGLSLSIPVLTAEKPEIIDLLFNLSIYHFPDHITLPSDYAPPQMAVNNVYWKSWIILLIYCAHVPSVFGTLAWERYPTLKVFIEMCITNRFVFPQYNDEAQIQQIEKQKILEFECHLAAASSKVQVSITESNSLLLNQLTSLEPAGPARRPPSRVLEELKSLNKTHQLDQLLSRSRNPDFLLDTIRKEHSSQSMPWITDLVQKCENIYEYLSIQAWCEYLLSSTSKHTKYQELILYLRGIITDSSRDPTLVAEILDYLLRRLSAHTNKEYGLSALRQLLQPVAEDEIEITESQCYSDQCFYILTKLPFLSHFQSIKCQIIRTLREICILDNEPDLVNSYLLFLSQHATTPDVPLNILAEVVYDMATLIVERSTLIAAIIPLTVTPGQPRENTAVNALLKIFYVYLTKVREPKKEECSWSESADSILVTWPSGKQATFPIAVIHGTIILLAYGPSRVRHLTMYNHLLDMWFPAQRQNMPRGYLLGTSEQALLLPDWLKLKMVRSGIPRLLEEALIDLEFSQLLLFFQSFGLPIESMNRLLAILDHVVATGKIRIEDFPLDKGYMTQLVDVQHRKGAIGGRIFADMLRNIELNTSAGPPVLTIEDQFMDIEDVKDLSDMLPRKILSPEELDYVLDKLHVDIGQGIIAKHMREQRQQLLQMISNEIMNSRSSPSYLTPVLTTLIGKLMRKCNADTDFVRGLLRNVHFPCRLFRLLMTVNNRSYINCLGVISQTIHNYAATLGMNKNLLLSVLNGFTKKTASALDPIVNRGLIGNDLESLDFIKALEHSSVESIEKASCKILELETIKTHGNKQLVESVASLLQSNQNVNRTGLFIDLLVQIEPEIIGSSLNLQLEILFSRNTQWKSIYKCRPYLLTLLIHHASWYTLEKAVLALLSLDSTKIYDPTSVLDFLSAVARSPKFLQGREKIASKHQKPIDMLHLTNEQLLTVTEYMILEVELNGYNKDVLDRFNNRIFGLIEKSIVLNKPAAKIIFDHLKNGSSLENRKDVCHYFMIQLYLRIPSLKIHFPDVAICEEFNALNITRYSSCLLDTMSHAVLTSVTTDVQNMDWTQRSKNLELVIRKMASTHPFLTLRQLHILQVSLTGRTHLEWPVFRMRNYYSLFMLILDVLELLKPHLFLSEYSKTLHAIFNSYFELLKNYHQHSEIRAMLDKFISLLESYINHNTEQAVVYFQSQSVLFKTLQDIFPSLRRLFVMTGDKKDSKHKGGIVITSTWSKSEPTTVEYSNVINTLKYNDAGVALQELDRCTLNKPTLIEPVIEQLFPLLVHPSSYIRTMSHTLLIRCMKYNPSIGKRVLPGILSCLETANAEIVESALESIPDLVVCCQENAVPVLSKLFSLGITHNINALPCITRAVSLLKLQINC